MCAYVYYEDLVLHLKIFALLHVKSFSFFYENWRPYAQASTFSMWN